MPLTVLITGCSSGIGLATAVKLAEDAEKRFLVYATILKPLDVETRFQDAVDGKEILEQTLFPVQMDVTKDESVKDAVALVMKNQGRIDVLVNNAGVALINVSEQATMEQAKLVFEVNFFGTLRVTREVLPGMKKRKCGRIINITSATEIGALPYLGLYSATKQAVGAFSQETAIIGRFFNIWVSLIEPGIVDTPIRDMTVSLGLGGLDVILQNPDVDDTDKRLAKYFENDTDYHDFPMQHPEELAALVLEAATAEKPHFRYQACEPVNSFAKRVFVDPTGDSFIEYQAERLKPYANKV